MKKQEPTRLQYSLRAHLAALTERDQPPAPATDEDAHYGTSGISTDETPTEGGAQ